MDNGQIILFQTQGGETKIEVRLSNETVWLTADQMAELFQRNKSTISRHIKNVLESGELQRNSVVAENATTASDGKTYTVAYYNLDMIISVGYRVNSHRGVQFRQWATQVLKDYMIKGFVLNDDLLARIRDIRSSEKVFYSKVLEIYALSIDYDPRTSITQQFFKTVQNKMHFAAHGHTAAEVIYDRANADQTLFLPQYQHFQKFRLCAHHALVLKNCLLLSGLSHHLGFECTYYLDYANH